MARSADTIASLAATILPALALSGLLAAAATEARACAIYQPQEKFAGMVEASLRGTVLDYEPLNVIVPRTDDPEPWASGGVITLRVDEVLGGEAEGLPGPGTRAVLPFPGTTFGDPMDLDGFLIAYGPRIEVGLQAAPGGTADAGEARWRVVRPPCSSPFITRLDG